MVSSELQLATYKTRGRTAEVKNIRPTKTDDLTIVLTHLLSQGVLDGPALGITKQAISEGIDSLSEAQLHVFKKYVVDEHASIDCARCGEEIPLSELMVAFDNGHLCSWCWHMTSKDD